MKYLLIIILSLFFISLETHGQQKKNPVERIYKEHGYYYTLVYPTRHSDRWFNLLVQFDSLKVLNTGHANTVNIDIQESGKIWQILNDTLYYLTKTEYPGNYNRPIITTYFQYPIDTVFKLKVFDDESMREADMFGNKFFPVYLYSEAPTYIAKQHTCSDIIHTKDEFTVFGSLENADTVMMIKDIPFDYHIPEKDYNTREHRYVFPHLGKFNVFKIDTGYYVLNDIGEFFHLQDSVPKKVGHIEYKAKTPLFYLKDNDTGTLSFNCRFLPLYPEYNNLVGYINPEHWLSKRYFMIKEEYLKELHELNRKTWK